MKKSLVCSHLLLPFSLLVCGNSQTNTDKALALLILLLKRNSKISISIAPERSGEEREKTVAVEEGKTAMDALKRGAYKVEEKMVLSLLLTGHTQDEAKRASTLDV